MPSDERQIHSEWPTAIIFIAMGVILLVLHHTIFGGVWLTLALVTIGIATLPAAASRAVRWSVLVLVPAWCLLGYLFHLRW